MNKVIKTKIFQHSNQISISNDANHLGNRLYQFDNLDDQIILNLICAAYLLANGLKIFKIQKLQINENQKATIIFESPTNLKLKALQKNWSQIKQQLISLNTLKVAYFELPFLSLNLKNQTLNLNENIIETNLKPERISLINLSTFTESNVVYHNLTFQIDQTPAFYINDHRKLNKTLKFFYFSKLIGSGLPFWLPRGLIVKNLIRNFIRDLEKAAGFTFVETPILGSEKIYQTSEHLKHYREFMFPVLKRKNEALYLRPMTCPHHCIIFQSEPRSYLDLPLQISEDSLLFRQEASGALIGMERVRQMQLKDTHIFLPLQPKVIKAAIKQCIELTQTALKALQINIKTIYLSVNDEKTTDKFINHPHLWEKTIMILRDVLNELKINYQLMIGEAAFYGPKIDFQIDTALGHNITISTVQLDFSLPEKFQLKYRTSNEKNKYQTPILIHHGLIGTYERLLTILMEKNNGWLPFWLSPVQILILPLSLDPKIQNYAQRIHQLLDRYKLRSEIASSRRKLSENIQQSWQTKIPIRLFIGEQELTSQQITFQTHQQKKQTINTLAFVDFCIKKNLNKE